MKGIGTGSRDLEASEDRTALMDLERLHNLWHVQDIEAISWGVNHGRMSSAMDMNGGVCVWSCFELGVCVLINSLSFLVKPTDSYFPIFDSTLFLLSQKTTGFTSSKIIHLQKLNFIA